jgi:hypothetical protein
MVSPKTEWSEDELIGTMERLRSDPAAFDDALKTVFATTSLIKPYLAGLEPVVQALTLADLQVVYLMGFQNPEQRRAVLGHQEQLVRVLIKENEEYMAAAAAKAAGRSRQEAADG